MLQIDTIFWDFRQLLLAQKQKICYNFSNIMQKLYLVGKGVDPFGVIDETDAAGYRCVFKNDR